MAILKSDPLLAQDGSMNNLDRNNDNAKELNSVEEMGNQDSVIDLIDQNLNSSERTWENSRIESVTGSITVDEIIRPSVDYTYSSFGYPDPFKEPVIDFIEEGGDSSVAEANVKSSEIPMVSPLQAYPLQSLKAKGVWVLGNGEARAIITTPKNEGVIVKKNDPIAAGIILSISKNQILTRQYKIREDGVRIYDDITLPFGEKKTENKGVVILEPGKDPKFKVRD